MRFIDCTGNKYNMLTVLGREESRGNKTFWKCLCDCGNISIVDGWSLRSGKTKSCGCLIKDKWRDYINSKSQPLYGVWLGMKARCHNKNVDEYKHYGERGICVCNEWLDFTIFKQWALANGYQKSLSIDRINVDGDYEPENCRFVTQKEQQRNRRNNCYIDIDGEKFLATDIAEMLGLPASTISKWVKQGVIYHKLIFGEDITRTKAKVTKNAHI